MSRFIRDMPTGLSDQVQRVAGMIVSPGDFVVERLKDDYSSMNSAVASPESNFKVSWNNAGSGYQPPAGDLQLPIQQWGAFVFRNALRSAVVYELSPSNTSYYVYQAVFSPSATGIASQQDIIANNETKTVDPQYWLFNNVNLTAVPGFPSGNYPPTAASWAPHGPVLFAGEDNDRRYVWIDIPTNLITPNNGNGTVMFQVNALSGTPVAPGVIVRLYDWNGGQDSLVSTTTFLPATGSIFLAGGNTATSPIPKSGYYRIEIANFSGVTVNYSLYTLSGVNTGTNRSLGAAWGHKTINQYWPTNINNVTAVRMLGISAWLSNQASPLNQQGNLVISQIAAQQDWYGLYASSSNPFNTVFDAAGTKEFVLKDGVYGFLKPTGQKDFEYLLDVQIGQRAVATETAYQLQTPRDYLAIIAACSQPGGGDCTLKLNYALEYKTANQWIEQRVATVEQASFSLGVQAVATMEQFYPNNIHWSKIFSTIGKIGKAAAPALSAFNPILGQLATGVGDVLAELDTPAVVTQSEIRSAEKDATQRMKRKIEAAQAVEETQAYNDTDFVPVVRRRVKRRKPTMAQLRARRRALMR